MILLIADLTGQQSISTGIGAMVLTALNGYQPFFTAYPSATSASIMFPYMISNTATGDWEAGLGYLSNSATLIRQIILTSSNSGSLVNFTAGVKNISSDIPAVYQNQLINPPFREITTAGPTALLPLDGTLLMNPTSSADQTVTVNPATLIPGRNYTVKDWKGIAATYPITITPASGLFDGNVNFVLSFNYQSFAFTTDGINFGGI